jgi:hypothetical protein
MVELAAYHIAGQLEISSPMVMDNHKSLSILIWNAQSIRNKSLELENFLNSNKINICLLTETWLRQGDNLSLQNYFVYRNDRIGNNPNKRNNGGGVAIAIRNDIAHIQLPTLKTEIIETIGLEVNGIRIYSVYFPGSRLNSEKISSFKADLGKITSIQKNYFLGGDLNAKHRFWNCTKGNKAGSILYNEMITRNFILHYPPSPTYFPSQSNRTLPSTIDVAISNGHKHIKNIHTINALSSDHLPVAFEIDSCSSFRAASTASRCYSKANWKLFRESIDEKIELSHTNVPQTKSMIDTAILNFETFVKEAENIAVPLQVNRHRHFKLDTYTMSLISLRNCLRRQSQRSHSSDIKKQVNLLNRIISKHIQRYKNNVLQKRLSSIPKNSNQLWKFSRILTSNYNKILPLKDTANQLLLTDKEKADEIGRIFNMAHYTTYNDASDSTTESMVKGSCHIVNFLSPEIQESILPTPKEIKLIIRKLKIKKSPGLDKINNILLKKLPQKAIIFLMHIFRACIKLCYFPDRWKHAKITPIPKPGKDLSKASNYRPISLLNAISKVFEKILVTRLNLHLSSNNILPAEQFGFRQSHSANHQLIRLYKSISNSFSMKKSTGMLTFDIEKAFDSVWHKGLVHKMFKLKFPLYIIKIIQSFLSQRSFQVSINGSYSKAYNIIAGVPQGSVLSPILFNIFTSDLIIQKCEKGMYADDTTLLVSAKNPDKIVKYLNLGSKQLSDYCQKWKIKLNGSKTKAAFFTRRKIAKWYPNDEVTVINSKISWDNTIKTLGLTFDKRLTFNRHTDLSIEKALKLFFSLYTLLNRKSHLNTTNKMTIYTAIIRSTLLYACPVWSNCAETHMNKLQIMQNKCLKTIFNLPRNHPTHFLHRSLIYPTFKEQVSKISLNFKRKLIISENHLIRSLQ